MVGQLLASEGFNSVEELALVEEKEIAGIEGFDEDTAVELQNRARDYLVKAVSLSGEVEDMYCLGACFESLARLAERRGRFRSATRLLGAGARIRESTGAAPDDPQELERLQTALCAQLGDNVYEACLREGAAMTMDEASQLAGAASAAASSETVGNVG